MIKKIATITLIIAFIFITISTNVKAEEQDFYVVSTKESSSLGFYLQPRGMNIGMYDYTIINVNNLNMTIKITNSTGEHILFSNKTIYEFTQTKDFGLAINNYSYGNIRIISGNINPNSFFETGFFGEFTYQDLQDAVQSVFISTLISTFFICIATFIVFKRLKESEVLEEEL